MKNKGLVLPPDFSTPAAPVAIIATDAAQVIDLLVAQGLAGRVDATSAHTALQLTDNALNPEFITIEMGRKLSRDLDADLALMRELDPSDPEETANFLIHPDGSFWPVPPAAYPALANQVPALIGADDVWFIAHRPTGKGPTGKGPTDKDPTDKDAASSALPPMPHGLRARDLIHQQEWVAAGVHTADQDPPSQFLAAPDWSDLTALIRVTGREVTIWRCGKGHKALLPLSWGFQRTWVHPSHGVIAMDPKATAIAFAASWRRAGGSAADAPLVELHQQSRLNNVALRPALTALGLPPAMVSQLCAQIPAAAQPVLTNRPVRQPADEHAAMAS